MKQKLLKITIAAILAAMLVASMILLTACGTSQSDLLPVKADKRAALNDSVEITFESTESFSSAIASLNMIIVYNSDGATYRLYNLETPGYVGTASYTELYYFPNSNGIFRIAVGAGANMKYGAINNFGAVIVEPDKENSSDIELLASGKILRVLTKYYKVTDDKTLSEEIADSKNLNFGIASGDIDKLQLCGDYIYAVTGAGPNYGLNVYGLNGELLKKFSSEAGVTYFILNDGNVLIRKVVTLPVASDEKNYTYFDTTNKYIVTYQIYNSGNKSLKTVNFNYYITSVTSSDSLSDSEKAEYSESYLKLNKIVAYTYNEKRLTISNDYKNNFLVDNSLGVKSDIGLYKITMLDENRYLHESEKSESSYIKDKDGKIIATIGSNFTIETTKIAGGLIVIKNAGTSKFGAINFEGEMVVNCEYDTLTGFFGGAAVGSKGTDYYTVNASGTATKIENYTSLTQTNFYRISNDYYSCNGTKIFAVANAATATINSNLMDDGSRFFRVTEGGVTKYYYVK